MTRKMTDVFVVTEAKPRVGPAAVTGDRALDRRLSAYGFTVDHEGAGHPYVDSEKMEEELAVAGFVPVGDYPFGQMFVDSKQWKETSTYEPGAIYVGHYDVKYIVPIGADAKAVSKALYGSDIEKMHKNYSVGDYGGEEWDTQAPQSWYARDAKLNVPGIGQPPTDEEVGELLEHLGVVEDE